MAGDSHKFVVRLDLSQFRKDMEQAKKDMQGLAERRGGGGAAGGGTGATGGAGVRAAGGEGAIAAAFVSQMASEAIRAGKQLATTLNDPLATARQKSVAQRDIALNLGGTAAGTAIGGLFGGVGGAAAGGFVGGAIGDFLSSFLSSSEKKEQFVDETMQNIFTTEEVARQRLRMPAMTETEREKWNRDLRPEVEARFDAMRRGAGNFNEKRSDFEIMRDKAMPQAMEAAGVAQDAIGFIAKALPLQGLKDSIDAIANLFGGGQNEQITRAADSNRNERERDIKSFGGNRDWGVR